MLLAAAALQKREQKDITNEEFKDTFCIQRGLRDQRPFLIPQGWDMGTSRASLGMVAREGKEQLRAATLQAATDIRGSRHPTKKGVPKAT